MVRNANATARNQETIGVSTSSDLPLDDDSGQVSPVEITEFKLRIAHGSEYEHGEVVREIVALGAAASPLVPFLAEQYRRGRLFLSPREIIDVSSATQSHELIEAYKQVGDRQYVGIEDRTQLYRLGFVEFEPDLLHYLYENWDRSKWDDAGLEPLTNESYGRDFRLWMRRQIVDSLAERGTQQALDLLEVIRARLASQVQEQRARLHDSDVVNTDLEHLERLWSTKGSWEQISFLVDETLLNRVREAAKRIRERLEAVATDVQGEVLESDDMVLEAMAKRIEVDLARFVLGAMTAVGPDWWEQCVPLPMRQRCAERQEEEGNRHPKHAYFTLIDLKQLIQKNWQLFEAHLRAAGCQGGKDAALAWLDQLNELRRMVGHPLKKAISGYNFTAKDRDLLQLCDERVGRLLSNAGIWK